MVKCTMGLPLDSIIILICRATATIQLDIGLPTKIRHNNSLSPLHKMVEDKFYLMMSLVQTFVVPEDALDSHVQ